MTKSHHRIVLVHRRHRLIIYIYILQVYDRRIQYFDKNDTLGIKE